MIKMGNREAVEKKIIPSDNFRLVRSHGDPKLRWVDGTPENSHYVYSLNMLFPKSKFIHIVRNPKKSCKIIDEF